MICYLAYLPNGNISAVYARRPKGAVMETFHTVKKGERFAGFGYEDLKKAAKEKGKITIEED